MPEYQPLNHMVRRSDGFELEFQAEYVDVTQPGAHRTVWRVLLGDRALSFRVTFPHLAREPLEALRGAVRLAIGAAIARLNAAHKEPDKDHAVTVSEDHLRAVADEAARASRPA